MSNLSVDYFKAAKKESTVNETTRMIHRKKADRQQLNGYEYYECKKMRS